MGAMLFFVGYLGVGCSLTELVIRWMLPSSWWQVSAEVPTYGWGIILGVSVVVVVSCLGVMASKRWGQKLLLITTSLGMLASALLGVGLMLVLAFVVLFQLSPELREKLHFAGLRWASGRGRHAGHMSDTSVSVLWTCAVLLMAWLGVVILGCKNVLP